MLPARVLIANRGEIAIRVAETCHRLGIEAVGVFAASDAGALFTRRLDQAIPIGGLTAADSYLRGDLIIQAALEAGAEALHPGYGFLSEHADFAEACAKAGVTFIGPSPAAMRLLGNKIAALRLAARVGIPTLPGYYEADQSASRLVAEATRVGFPLLIKAAAGGGGRGMRVVHDLRELGPALEAAQREAAAFGDRSVFLERYVPAARHVEIQLLADMHGAVLVLGDRDCTVQRRHQKVIEEAPAPALAESTRETMYEASRQLARAADYTNAGTVEFLVDGDRCYFLEINTRLQVEHPVTEQATGLDIVELQIRVAAGEKLPLTQREITVRGHAIEARLYAEDPSAGFLPSAGTLERCSFPHLPGVRIDAGVEQGDSVSPRFDPLLAKLIAEGETREIAIRRLDAALARTSIAGIATNRSFLRAILRHPTFLAVEHTTGFLAEHELDLVPRLAAPDPEYWLAAAVGAVQPACASHEHEDGVDDERVVAYRSLWSNRLGAWRHGLARHAVTLAWQSENRTVVLWRDASGAWHELSTSLSCALGNAHASGYDVVCSGPGGRMRVKRRGLQIFVSSNDREVQFSLAPPPSLADRQHAAPSSHAHAHAVLTAPMPGTVSKHYVEEGMAVAANQPLLAIEAMKMEHIVVAPHAGMVKRLPFAVGALAPAGAVLVELEPRRDDHERK